MGVLQPHTICHLHGAQIVPLPVNSMWHELLAAQQRPSITEMLSLMTNGGHIRSAQSPRITLHCTAHSRIVNALSLQ